MPAAKSRTAFKIVLAGLGLVLGLGLLEAALRLATVEDRGRPRIHRTPLLPFPLVSDENRRMASEVFDASYFMPDPTLGWTIRPGGTDRKANLYRANSIGLRSLPREAEPRPPAGIARILCVGDSFTHCDEVPYEASWTAALEEGLGSGHEVLNAGVSGYGTDQAFLRWRMLGPGLGPQVVLLGILPENLFRNVNVFRSLEYPGTSFVFSKPRFVLEGDGIRAVNIPVIPAADVPAALEGMKNHPLRPFEHWYQAAFYEEKVLDCSRLYRYFRSRAAWNARARLQQEALQGGSEAVRVTARIARAFRDEVRQAGARPLVFLIPSVKDLIALREGRRPMAALAEALGQADVEALDVAEFLASAPEGADPPSLYVEGVGHLNAAGNRVVARALIGEVRRMLAPR